MHHSFKHPDSRYLALCDCLTESQDPYFEDWDLRGRFRGEDTKGLAGVYESRSRKEQVIAFRGSSAGSFLGTSRNVLTDLNFLPTGPLRVHRGFRNMLLDLFPSRSPVYEKGWTITLAGMSMGAAVATLYAKRYGADNLVLFGSPMVTKHPLAFERAIHRRSRHNIRIRNYQLHGDFIATLPGDGWGHIGDVHLFPEVWGPEHSRARYLEALEASHD